MRAASRISPGASLLLAALAVTAACTSAHTRKSTDAGSIRVRAGERDCELPVTTVPAGRRTFEVTNTSSQVTEVYVYAAGDQIMGEVENIGPSTTRALVVDLPAGRYQVACKPGMVGNGNRTDFTVTGTPAPTTGLSRDLQAAVSSYRSYVRSEVGALITATATFTAAIDAGHLASAKLAYAGARLHYERIEPVAESFGALDPLIDMRADDASATKPFVGFHALERLLFQRNTLTGAAALAAALTRDLTRLNSLVATVRFTPLVMGNGAKSLLDEVAKSKVTGEEERYSRIDLVDFAGNVDGAKYVFTALRPALAAKSPALVRTLDARFTTLVALLDTHRSRPGRAGYIPGSPYVSYAALTAPQIKRLAVEVDAISEPLGRISSVVASK